MGMIICPYCGKKMKTMDGYLHHLKHHCKAKTFGEYKTKRRTVRR